MEQKIHFLSFISTAIKLTFSSLLAISLMVASQSTVAGTCDMDRGVITCSSDTAITGGSYDSISIIDGANDTTLTVNDTTVNGMGGMIDASGFIYAGDGLRNHLILHNNTAAEIVGGGNGSSIDVYSGRYDRIISGRGDSTLNVHGDDAYIGAVSGDFYNDPAGFADTKKNHDIMNLINVTDAAEKSPLSPASITSMQDNNFEGDAAGYGFEEINLLEHSNLTLSNDLWNAGKADYPVLSLDNTSQLNVTGSQTVYGSINNGGTLNLDNGTVTNTLHLAGDYAGNGGTLILGTKLGDDASATDMLVVDGNTSGTTQVRVNNVGGRGAKSLNGIEVVSVGGSSDGEFAKQGRIVAGAYDYDLVKTGSNWYLTSTDTTPVPDPAPSPVPEPTPDPTPTPTPEPDPAPAPEVSPPSVSEPVVDNNTRPEAAAYGVNVAAANTLFTTTLHDRLGETHYVDATGRARVTSLWLRNTGGHNRSTDSSGQNKTQTNRYIMQLGGDIASWSSDGADRFHLGAMWGYANQHGNTRNHHTGYGADSSIDGYSAGLYGTWLQSNEEKTGAYVDTWLLYNWFDNSISGEDNPTENYKSKGITASVEAGYAWKLADISERSSWFIQPQAQLTYMGVEADDHREANGTRVVSEGDGNIQSRLGVRTYLKGHSALDDNADRTFEPFIEANWLHNTRSFGASLDGVRIDQAGARNIGELKAGVEAKVSQKISLWGNLAQQVGDKGYSDTQGTLGLKVSF